MNRLKLVAMAMLLMVPIACGDPPIDPPPAGSIDGLVSIDGQGQDGISVTLSNGTSATTANGGTYRFDDVEAGAYTVTISNFPDDASFNATSAAATISTEGETVTVNFPGSWIRTSAIMGTVTVENEGLSGVTVSLTGVSNSETLTDGNGQYAFTGLRAGNYTIEISGFDDDDVAFGGTTASATLAVGESKIVAFDGTYLRASGIMGQVTADEQPQEGITVSMQGRGESRSTTTNAAGQYSFEQLRRGDYSVVISGYETDEVTFDQTSQTVTVARGETANVPFAGTLLRTAGIQGTVTVEGAGPIPGVTVTVQGEGETKVAVTDDMGAYAVDRLHAGDYSVVITGFDDDQYGFPDGTSATVTVALQETGTVPFSGIMLRTAAIEGMVTVGDDDLPLPGVTVTVSGGPRDEDHTRTTDDAGMYLVDNLHAGVYSVSISGYDTDEYGFAPTTESVDVGLRETAEVAFQGDLLRTAGVSGRVHVAGVGMPGITVTVTGEESREGMTDGDGQYGFSGLAAGDYTVTITGWDEVEYYFAPEQEVMLELDQQMTGVNFPGRKLRTAMIEGSVTAEGEGLAGIAVNLIKILSANTGEDMGTMVTGADGAYSFGPLLAGAYLVSIAGYDDEHDFAAGATQATAVDTDETATVDFAATIIRTAGVSGMVTIDGDPMADVEVTLAGEHAPDDNTMMTGDDGMYAFGSLRKGTYTVSITNPDPNSYSFPSTSTDPLHLAVGQVQNGISFAGEALRTSGVSGRVHVGGVGQAGVTVTLSGDADAEEMTDADGQYGFSGLGEGSYTLTISGWDEVEYAFDASMAIDLAQHEVMTGVNFEGMPLRTAMVMGTVTVEGAGLAGIAVTLSGDADHEGMTGDDGGYSFGPLLAGDYQVTIAGYDDEHDWGEMGDSRGASVETDGTATVNFAATIIRTASVSGMVTVDGDPMEGVEVTIAGDHAPEDNMMMTGDDGMYAFGSLRKGDYTLSIANPDEDVYHFPSMERGPVNLSVGQEQGDVSFAGTRISQASISGQVHAEGDAIEGVTVTLSGDADATDMTDGNGEYNFPGLAGGTYTVTISGWDAVAYDFADDETAKARTIGSDDFEIVDFAGTHTRTASVKGKLFIDEMDRDGAYDAGEPMFDKAAWNNYLPEPIQTVLAAVTGVPLALHAVDDYNNPVYMMAAEDGTYEFGGLKKGDYVVRVALSIPDPSGESEEPFEIAPILAGAGYVLGGEGNDIGVAVTVNAGEASEQDFPFVITKQQINVQAVMGTSAAATETVVEGVELALYPSFEDANEGTNMLGTGETGDDGVASFTFMREDDTGPGAQGSDRLVYAKVTDAGHDDLELVDNTHIEIGYEAVDRETDALAAARLVNVQVNFQWWVKSNAGARNGDRFLGGWAANHGDSTTAANGRASYSVRLSAADAIAGESYSVMLADDQTADATGGERWSQSAALSHTHDHLALPADNEAADNDLGPIYVTWTSQTLTLGFYREADDVEGFTNYQSGLPGGDHRPHARAGAVGSIRIIALGGDDRYADYKWDKDGDPETSDDTVTAADFDMEEDGMIRYTGIPATDSIAIRFIAAGDRKVVNGPDRDINPWGDDLNMGMSQGAFGGASGGLPEVKLCSASVIDMSDDWCATFGYQWTNGSVSGEFQARLDDTYSTWTIDSLEVGMEMTATLAAQTRNHGALGDDSATVDEFEFDNLQDGTYMLSTVSTDDYTVDSDSIHMFEVFYDEGTGAAFVGDPVVFNVTDQDPPLSGLHIRGFVGNDANNNKAFVGGETREVTLSLGKRLASAAADAAYASAGTTTTTDGHYSFNDLDARYVYRVTVTGAAGYQGLRNSGDADDPLTSSAGRLVPAERGALGSPVLPRWDMQGDSVINQNVADGDDEEAMFVNFALVYTGGISGTVNVLGGSMAGAQVVAYQCTGADARDGCPLGDDDRSEAGRTTSGANGSYTLPSLREGYYTVMLDDPSNEFLHPAVDSMGNPDDDARHNDPDGGEPITVFADSTINATLRGQDPNVAVGPLHVYRSSMSATVEVFTDSISLIGYQHGTDAATYGVLDTVPDNGTTIWAARTLGGSEAGTATFSGGLAWSSSTVTVRRGIPVVGSGTTLAFEGCPGDVCALKGDTTDTDGSAGLAQADTIVFLATAANGYNDTAYATAVNIAAPADAILETTDFTPNTTDEGGDFSLATAGPSNSSIIVTITLESRGDGDDEICVQSVSIDGETATDRNNGGGDGCTAQYNLDVGDYEITVTSEDGVPNKYDLEITQGT